MSNINKATRKANMLQEGKEKNIKPYQYLGKGRKAYDKPIGHCRNSNGRYTPSGLFIPANRSKHSYQQVSAHMTATFKMSAKADVIKGEKNGK